MMLKKQVAVLSAVLLTGGVAVAQEMAWRPGVLLGRGYDALAGAPRQDCVEFAQTSVPAGGLHRVEWQLVELTSNKDLLSLLSVNATASLDLGIASGSAESKIVRNSEINNFSANYMAHARAEKQWDFARDVRVNAALQDLSAEDFRTRCGDHYVSGVLLGGTFYGVISVETTSLKDKEAIVAAIEASIGPFAGSGDFDQQTEQTIRNRSGTIRGHSSGSTAAPIPLTWTQLKERFSSFPLDIQQSGGTAIRFIVTPYPQVSFAMPGNLDRLLKLYWEYASLLYEIEYVLDHTDQFYMDRQSYITYLQSMYEEVDAIMASLRAAAGVCGDDPDLCAMPGGLRRPNAFRSELPPRYRSQCLPVTIGPQVDMNVYPLGARCGGDKEMGGNNPSIRIESGLVPTRGGRVIDVSTYVHMRERGGDRTCFHTSPTPSRQYFNVSVAFPGCYIRSQNDIVPQSGRILGDGGNDNHDFDWYANGTGILSQARCRSDNRGDDFGRTGCDHVNFRDVRVTLSHEEDRTPPPALAEQTVSVWANQAAVTQRIERIGDQREQKLRAVLARAGITDRPIPPRGAVSIDESGFQPAYGGVVSPQPRPTRRFRQGLVPIPIVPFGESRLPR